MVYDPNKSTEYDPDKRKLLSTLCHGSIFLSSTVVSVGIPVAVLFVSEDPIVKASAKEAINFHINVWLYEVIVGVLGVLSLGLLLPILLPIFSFSTGYRQSWRFFSP